AAALERMREARSLDPRNGVVRTVLVNTLLEQARDLLSKDWEKAEPLLREALEVEPGHAAAQSLITQVGDRKREEFVSWCATQARRLQADGDVNGALAVVEQGLSTYPKERVLQQLRSTLERAKNADTGSIALDEAFKTQQAMTPPLDKAGASPVGDFESTKLIPPTRDVAASLLATPPPGSPPAKPQAPPAAGPKPPVLPKPPQPQQAATPPAATPQAPGKGAPPPAAGPAKAAPPAQPDQLRAWLATPGARMAIAGVVALIAVAAIFVVVRVFSPRHTAPPVVTPTATMASVTVRSSDPRAAISVDDQSCGTGSCTVHLGAGEHHATATLSGFAPASSTFT